MPTQLKLDRRDVPLILTALFAAAWAVARAAVQSITVDEADTFVMFAAQPWPSEWYPSSNNHVLNSLLIRLFTSVLGVSQFSVRLPALIGAGIYIASAYSFCRLFAESRSLRWTVFVCLVYNPFVFDYLAGVYKISASFGASRSCGMLCR